MPPISFSRLRAAFADDPPLLRKVSREAIVLGLIVAAAGVVFAIAHFGFGMPVLDRKGEAAAPRDIVTTIVVLTLGGMASAAFGAWMRSWEKR